MFKKIFCLLTKTGEKDLAISSIFFAFYGVSSICMLLTVFSILFKIKAGLSLEYLYYNFIILIVLVVAKGIFNMVADLKKHNVGFDIVQQIREKMIIKLKLFSLGFYTKERLGEINIILSKDINNMENIVGHMFTRIFGDFLVALIVVIGLLFLDIKLTLMMIISIPIALIFLFLSIKNANRVEKQNNSALVNMVSLFVEYVRGISVIKSFLNNKSLTDELQNKTKEFGLTSKQASKFKAKQLSIFVLLLDIGYFLLVLYGGSSVINDSLDIFVFIIFVVVSREFYKPFLSMEKHYMYYISAVDSYNRLSKILYADVIKDKKDGIIPVQNNISFNNIKFAYEADEFNFSNLNFEIGENTMTALVGESGSGKTTITNLLLRFYDIDQGIIKLGNENIKNVPYDELLDRIGIVMQNVQLFSATIAENIKIGKKNASEQEIINAAKKAKIDDFIMSLPDKYNTHIGENGCLLSGGQRQRISIARAFLKDAPILILDEMTSNVDPINEALIQEAISDLSHNRTVIVIAHHLKTIVKADQILVFKKGSLLESGRHKQLLEKKGYYAKLWQSQYGI